MSKEAPDDLIEELIQRLEERGVPEGAWLLDIERIRSALSDADDLLRRLKDAIIRAALLLLHGG